MKFCIKILNLRKNSGMSHEKLAEQLGVSAQSVLQWELDMAYPNIEDIKKMSKLFGVTFDYLMNDEIDIINTKDNNQIKNKPYRYAFDSNIKMYYLQADIDCGYSRSRKNIIDNSMEIFKERYDEMNNMLAKIGVDKTIQLQVDLAGCFFENTKQLFFGFYYGGNIQFLCPFENFINAQICNSGYNISYDSQLVSGIGVGSNGIESVGIGSIPFAKLNKPSSYTLVISYFDENSMVNEFKLNLYCKRRYTILETGSADDAELMASMESDSTFKKLNEIIARMHSYPIFAQKIKNNEISVDNIDSTNLKTIIDAAQLREYEYEEAIENDAISHNQSRTKKIYIAIGILSVIILFSVLLVILT